MKWMVIVGLAAAGATWSAAMPGPDAAQVLQKTNDTFRQLKTYQATYRSDLGMAGKGTMSVSIDIKTIPGKKIYIKIEPVGKGTGALAVRMQSLRAQVYDDGKQGLIYSPISNSYLKGPHMASYNSVVSGYAIILGDFRAKPGIRYSLLPDTVMGGRPVFVVEGKGAGPGSPTIHVYVDKGTHMVRQVKMTGKTPGGATDITSTLVSEKINAPVPDSAFVFTPPPGAKQVSLTPPTSSAPGRK